MGKNLCVSCYYARMRDDICGIYCTGGFKESDGSCVHFKDWEEVGDMNYIEEIVQNISESERLAQLAEEAAELSQAALKLRRAKRRDNPTNVTKWEARKGLLEEIADVLNCLDTMKLSAKDAEFINEIRKRKLERWADRINGKQK